MRDARVSGHSRKTVDVTTTSPGRGVPVGSRVNASRTNSRDALKQVLEGTEAAVPQEWTSRDIEIARVASEHVAQCVEKLPWESEVTDEKEYVIENFKLVHSIDTEGKLEGASPRLQALFNGFRTKTVSACRGTKTFSDYRRALLELMGCLDRIEPRQQTPQAKEALQGESLLSGTLAREVPDDDDELSKLREGQASLRKIQKEGAQRLEESVNLVMWEGKRGRQAGTSKGKGTAKNPSKLKSARSMVGKPSSKKLRKGTPEAEVPRASQKEAAQYEEQWSRSKRKR